MTVNSTQISLGLLQIIGLMFPFLLGVLRLYISDHKEPNEPAVDNESVKVEIWAPRAVRYILLAITLLLIAAAASAGKLLTETGLSAPLLSISIVLLVLSLAAVSLVAFRILLDYFGVEAV